MAAEAPKAKSMFVRHLYEFGPFVVALPLFREELFSKSSLSSSLTTPDFPKLAETIELQTFISDQSLVRPEGRKSTNGGYSAVSPRVPRGTSHPHLNSLTIRTGPPGEERCMRRAMTSLPVRL